MITTKQIPSPIPNHVFANLNKNIYKTSSSHCWDWKGRKQNRNSKSKGYGLIAINKSVFRVTRILYYLVYREDPLNNVIRHTCDNSHCVNPYHLLIGTQQDNLDDAKRRDRIARGSSKKNSKLTEELVRQIRLEWQLAPTSWRHGAKLYGINYNTFKSMILKKTWKHV